VNAWRMDIIALVQASCTSYRHTDGHEEYVGFDVSRPCETRAIDTYRNRNRKSHVLFCSPNPRSGHAVRRAEDHRSCTPNAVPPSYPLGAFVARHCRTGGVFAELGCCREYSECDLVDANGRILFRRRITVHRSIRSMLQYSRGGRAAIRLPDWFLSPYVHLRAGVLMGRAAYIQTRWVGVTTDVDHSLVLHYVHEW
jgi:hypothetical protein